MLARDPECGSLGRQHRGTVLGSRKEISFEESSLTDAAFGVTVSDLAVRAFAAVAVKVVTVALFEVLDLACRERLFVERYELVRL